MATRTLAYIRSNLLGAAALVVALTFGTAYAADKIGSKDIKRGAVKSKHVRNGSLLSKDFAPGQLPGTSAAVPSGAVSFFNRSACPSGWAELTEARGRYVVGLPAGGTLDGSAGTALTNLEDRPVGLHTHTVNDPMHRHSWAAGAGYVDAVDSTADDQLDLGATSIGTYSNFTNFSTTGITINSAGSVAGTNAPYLQLLACQKG